MDAFNDPMVEEVIVMSSAQVGKTTIIENVTGYYIEQDPSPMLLLQPTLDVAKSFSKDRLAPMLRDTPALLGRVRDAKTRDKDNTILHKLFPGGHITMAGANSPASLASRPIRIVLQDEIDRYPLSAGTEGDPGELADKRATTFWNRKKGKFSTPTIKGRSRIETLYNSSDIRKYYVPCPHCQQFFVMKWAQVKWEKGKPEDAVYVCEFCSGAITDLDKMQMIREGEWRAEGQFKGTAGFWINELYSPWVSFGNMAVRFTKANKKRKEGDNEALKVFINTSLAETWAEGTQNLDEGQLINRRENYGPELPNGVMILVAAVDVQVDRLEIEVNGYGFEEENFSIIYKILPGNPSFQQVWLDLDEYLQRTWTHKSGLRIIISACAIDSGYKTDEVYAFVRPRQYRNIHGFNQRIIAIKGAKEATAPIIPAKPSRVGANNRVFLYHVGVNQGKDLLNTRLQLREPGPGYVHFPVEYDEEYFKQLTNEYCKYEKGVRRWIPRTEGARTEALDIKIYSIAALRIGVFKTFNPNWERLLEQHQKRVDQLREGEPEKPVEAMPQGRRVISEGVRRE